MQAKKAQSLEETNAKLAREKSVLKDQVESLSRNKESANKEL